MNDHESHDGRVRAGDDGASAARLAPPDRIVTATAEDGSFSVVAGITTTLVRETQARHALGPLSTVALGQLVSGAALLGAGLKGRERLSLRIASDGPLRGLVADVELASDRRVLARAMTNEPTIDLPLETDGTYDLPRAIGAGHLQVTRSFEIGQPYVGIVPLLTGEIGADLASYLGNSQQIPSVVALGVLVKPSGVASAGGVIAQILPSADESTIATLERRTTTMPPVSALVEAGVEPEDLARTLAGPMALRNFASYEVAFGCRCTRELVEVALLGLGADELRKIGAEGRETEAVCEFCKRRYVLDAADVRGLVERLGGAV